MPRGVNGLLTALVADGAITGAGWRQYEDRTPMTDEALLAYYATPGVLTYVRGFEAQLGDMADDVASVVRVVQGLLIHEGLTGVYGVTLPTERIVEKQIVGARALLAQAARLDSRPITEARAPERRVVGVCRHFATLFVAIMRSKGVPARARCGFAGYFAAGKHLDHWVGEYWHAAERRWVLVDAQIDEAQRGFFRIDLDTLDVPRDRFLVGGDAWRACRAGADPMSFGVAGTPMWGLVEVYGDLFQDLAALQKIELLPWGWYGLATDESGMQEHALIDRLAELSSRADAGAIAALRRAIADDPRLGVPDETVAAALAADQATTTA